MRSIDTKYAMNPDGSIEAMTTAEWIERMAKTEGQEGWDAAHRIDKTVVGKYEVSTVFLSHDHRYLGDGPPILFETMVFDHSEDGPGWLDLYCDRYCTRPEAEAGHARIVAALEAGADPSELDAES